MKFASTSPELCFPADGILPGIWHRMLRAVTIKMSAAVLFIFGFVASAFAQPVISSPPFSKLATVGQSVSFSVNASGTGTLSYIWKRNGQVLSGQTTPILSIANAAMGDRGWYEVAVSNAQGTTSSFFQFEVAAPAAMVIGWGQNVAGETATLSGTPDIAVAVGGDRATLVLRTNGTVSAWGQMVPAVLNNVVGLAFSNRHALAVRGDGTVAAWGESAFGGTIVPSDLSRVVGVAAGGNHSLALRSDGTVVGWGSSSGGGGAVPAGLTRVVKIAAGFDQGFALKNDGTVVAWGAGSYLTVPEGLSGVVDIAAGTSHTLALKSDGTVVGWGEPVFGAAAVPPGLTGVVAIAAGGNHSIALKADGTVVVWGSSAAGLDIVPGGLAGVVKIGAGLNHSLAVFTPAAITSQPASQTVVAGSPFVASIGTSGAFSAFRWFKNGQPLVNGGKVSGAQSATLTIADVQSLDRGSYTVVVENPAGSVTSQETVLTVKAAEDGPPVAVTWPLSQRVVVGQSTTFTVVPEGSGPYSFQWKRDGQILPGKTAATLDILNADLADQGLYSVTITNAAAKSATFYAALEVSIADGTPIAWGVFSNLASPAAPTGLRGISAVAAGNEHMVGLKANGTLVAWGGNSSGEQTIPAGLNNVISVAVGAAHTVALVGDGSVVAWGGNWQGQRNVPPGLSEVVRIFAGRERSAALRADGTLVTWGANFYDLDRPNDLGPVQSVILGETHTLAIKANGMLVGWGRGDSDELEIPAGLGPVRAIFGQQRKSLAIEATGAIRAWGYGAPALPADLVGVRTIASGGELDIFLKADGSIHHVGNYPPPAGLSGVVAVSVRSSASVALIPAAPPHIDLQPAIQRVTPGDTATFAVTASGSIPLAYQWLRDGLPIPDATASTLTLSNVQLAQAGQYSVIVTNAFGQEISSIALLTGTNPAPIVTSPPQPVASVAGQPVNLSVGVTGVGGLAYQWRRDGTVLPGATSAVLNLGPGTLALSGVYDVVVTDGLSATTSSGVNVQVAPQSYPQVVSVDPAVGAAFEDAGGFVADFFRLANGKVLVAGDFSRVLGVPGNNLARLAADGSGDPSFTPIAIDGPVFAVAVQPDEKIVLGGTFRNVGGYPRNGLVRLNPDGGLDHSFIPEGDFNGVYALALQSNGRIVLGGGFPGRLARVYDSGDIDSDFAPSPNGTVYALLVQSNVGGRIVVGGSFTSISGSQVTGLARLNADGSIDGPFAGNDGADNSVFALQITNDGRIVVGGAFTSYRASVARRIARLLSDGTIDPTFSTGSGFNSSVYGLEVRNDGRILAAGAFGGYNGTSVTAVAQLQANGSLDLTFRPLTFTQAVDSVTFLDSGQVLAGGSFIVDGGPGTFMQGIALIGSSGTVSFSKAPGLMLPAKVNKIVHLPDGRVVAGGPFVYVNGVSAPYLARLNADNSLDTTFTTNAIGRPNLPIHDIVVQNDGKLVIAGEFLAYKSTFISKVARIFPNGDIDATFRPGDLMGPTPDRVLTMPGGRLLVAAKGFPLVFGNPLRRDTLLAIKADGSIDLNFTAARLPAGEVHALLVQPDGKIVVGGSFRTFNGTACDFIVRLLPSGVLDPDFAARANDVVRGLALQPDGKIIVIGDFQTINDVARGGVARLQPDGALDGTFVPQFSLDAAPTLVRLQADGKILLAGSFTSVSNQPSLRHLVRVLPGGAIDTSFAAPALDAALTDLAMTESGALWLAGEALRLHGVPRSGVLKTVSVAGPIILAQPVNRSGIEGEAITLTVGVVGGTNVTYQWLKNGAAIAGANQPNLTLGNARATDSGSYFARVTHAGGTLDSASATLDITPSKPVLATNSIFGSAAVLKNGSRWALTAPTTVAGTLPISYQWSKDGNVLPGENSATLLVKNWQPADAGSYRVTLSNSVGSVLSDPLTQSVATAPEWAWLEPSPQGNSLLTVNYLNGRFVAGGFRGTILTSSNGTAWTLVRVGVNNSVMGFAHGNGTFVALSSFGGAWSSSDALEWTPRETNVGTDGRYLSAIAFGSGRFVATGDHGLVVTSTNGAAWSATASGVNDGLGAIAFGGGKFVALGGSGRTFVSSDGLSWAAGPVLPQNVSTIAFGAGRFVAGGGKQLFTSTDAQSWTGITLTASANLKSIQFAVTGFLAALDSTDGKYWFSTDGLTWQERSMDLTLNTAAAAFTYGNGRFVMAGGASDTLATSTDGTAWTRVTRNETLEFVGVASGGGTLLAVGSHGAVRILANGTRTIHLPNGSASSRPTDVAYGLGKFVVAYSGGEIWESTDGQIWNPGVFSTGHSYTGASFVNNRFFVLGANGVLQTSVGAISASWTVVGTGTTRTLRKMAFGAGTYVAVGDGGTVLSSTNALNWTARDASGVTSTINDVIFAGGQFVLVSEGGSIRTSANGITWTGRTNPIGTGLKSLVYGGGKYFAFASGTAGYITSLDGINWSAAQHGNANTTVDAVEFNGEIYLVTANGGLVSQPLNLTVPGIVTPPQTQTVARMAAVSLSVNPSGTGPFFYQWFRNNAPILGATSATFLIPAASLTDAGSYTVLVSNAGGSVMSAAATLEVVDTQPGLLVGTAMVSGLTDALTGVFTVEGGSPKKMLLRAVGPALENFGVAGVVTDPTMRVIDAITGLEVAYNDNWGSAPNALEMATVAAQVGAWPVPLGGKDAGVLATFGQGTYRIMVGPAGVSGTVSLEIYDADSSPRLVYMATRVRVSAEKPMRQGLVFSTSAISRKYLIRALGPSLGLSGALADPQLKLFSDMTQLAANDNWVGDTALVESGIRAGAMPIPTASKDAGLIFSPPASGVYVVEVAGVAGAAGTALLEIFEADTARSATAPLAIVSQSSDMTVDAGQPARLGVVVVGKPAPSFQWRKGAVPIAGANSPALSFNPAQAVDAGIYTLDITNGGATSLAVTSTLTVNPVNNATQATTTSLPAAGGTVTLANAIHYVGSPASVGWSVTLPSGWSLASDTATTAATKPASGAIGTLTWTWSTPTASPVGFTYTLNVPAGEITSRYLVPSASVNGQAVAAAPGALQVFAGSPLHAADTSYDSRISLLELTRVIELYNTRNGTTRTGCYRLDVNGEDGFAPEPTRASAAVIALTRYHAGDSNRDGKLSLLELTRVIELYNYRSGTTRTGQYRVQAGTEDGFAPGP